MAQAVLARRWLPREAPWITLVAVLGVAVGVAAYARIARNLPAPEELRARARETARNVVDGKALASGDVEKARKLDIDENVYFEIIRQETASLIASCCACGAAKAGVARSAQVQAQAAIERRNA